MNLAPPIFGYFLLTISSCFLSLEDIHAHYSAYGSVNPACDYYSLFLMEIDTPPAEERSVYRQIKTNEYMQWLQLETSIDRGEQYELEQGIEYRAKRKPVRDSLIIPVVFHVVYNADNEEPITEQQIESQIDALNRDFSAISSINKHPVLEKERFYTRVGYAHIRFCLALEGDKKGINYIDSKQDNWTYDNQIKGSRSGGVDPWNTDRYLNIWVSTLADSVNGFAQMPGYDPATDGIVIDHRFFGSTGTAIAPYDQGKTLTHLVGNYLSVYSLWGTRRCADDKVLDTPIHGGPNYGCPKYMHVSSCDNNPVEMILNFMDNTDDDCMSFFTEGQINRMYATLAPDGPRSQLGQEAGTSLCSNTDTADTLDSMAPIIEIKQEKGRRLLVVTSRNIEKDLIDIDLLDRFGKSVIRNNRIKANDVVSFDCSSLYPGPYFFKFIQANIPRIQKIMLQ